MTRDRSGIAARERKALGIADEAPVGCQALDPDPARKLCRSCGRRVMFVRKVYGPKPRAAHWQHVGDGLVQYRSWGVR